MIVEYSGLCVTQFASAIMARSNTVCWTFAIRSRRWVIVWISWRTFHSRLQQIVTVASVNTLFLICDLLRIGHVLFYSSNPKCPLFSPRDTNRRMLCVLIMEKLWRRHRVVYRPLRHKISQICSDWDIFLCPNFVNPIGLWRKIWIIFTIRIKEVLYFIIGQITLISRVYPVCTLVQVFWMAWICPAELNSQLMEA